MDTGHGDEVRTLLGVEVLEVGQVLEVVGVDAAVFNEGVGGDVVVDDLDLQCDTLLSQDVLDDLEDLGVGRGVAAMLTVSPFSAL